MEFEVTLKQSDFMKFSRFIVREARRSDRYRLSYVCVCIFLFFVFIGWWHYNLGWSSFFALLAGMLLWIVLGMFNANALYRSMIPVKQGFILGPKKFRIDSEGVRTTVTATESHTRWSGVVRVVENRDYFYIFLDKNAAHIIPRDQVDVPALTGELKKYCPNYEVG